VINSSLQHVALVGVAVKALCTSLSLPQVDAYQLELCAVEAVTNAIKHAYDSKPGFSVQVSFAIYPDKLVLTVCDEGRKMPQLVIPSLDFDPTNLESLPESGMGLFLIQRIMDEVTYASHHGKNALTMIKRL
ncbi:MAG: ATP-binding protein, partial [Deltaproteobacteria bacterium]|nr:ATP-binding protein [Deltaproteobacteria bacterium]